MKKYPQRFSMFHVKDFHLPPNVSFTTHEEAKVTELGLDRSTTGRSLPGSRKPEDYACLRRAEAFDVPSQVSLKVNVDYMKNLSI